MRRRGRPLTPRPTWVCDRALTVRLVSRIVGAACRGMGALLRDAKVARQIVMQRATGAGAPRIKPATAASSRAQAGIRGSTGTTGLAGIRDLAQAASLAGKAGLAAAARLVGTTCLGATTGETGISGSGAP